MVDHSMNPEFPGASFDLCQSSQLDHFYTNKKVA